MQSTLFRRRAPARAAVRGIVAAMVGLLAAPARAETFVFQDGTFIDGTIERETSRTLYVKTPFGMREYDRKVVQEIIESAPPLATDDDRAFAELPDIVRAVRNARAEYDLKQYEKALARLEPFAHHDESPPLRRQVDWLIIEIRERLGQWDAVRTALKDKLENGSPKDKIRAQAHLAILDANPDYDLRFVGKKNARNFLKDDEIRNRARQPGSLRDDEIMRLALEEYCDQLLVEDELSVQAFAKKLDFQATYDGIKSLPRVGAVAHQLPYIDELKKAEWTIIKAQAVLGDYGNPFAMDLVRTEMIHLMPVADRLLDELGDLSPERLPISFDQRTGRLTPDFREQWRQRCDEFLDLADPTSRLLDYMVDRVDTYPEGLRDLRKRLRDVHERVREMVAEVKKARNRTHV